MPFYSPDVYFREVDLSAFAQRSGTTVFGMVGTARMGALDTLTDIRSVDELVSTFGTPNDYNAGGTAVQYACQGWHGARAYLRRGTALKFIRVDSAIQPAAYGRASVPGTIGAATVTQADGITSAAATRTLTSALGNFVASGISAGCLLTINDTSTPNDDGVYIIASVDLATQITVNRDWPTGGLTGLSYTVHLPIEEGADGATTNVDPDLFNSAGSDFVTQNVEEGDILVINDAVDTANNGSWVIETRTDLNNLNIYDVFPATGVLTGLSFYIYKASQKVRSVTQGTQFDDVNVEWSATVGAPESHDITIDNASVLAESYTSLTNSTVETEINGDSEYIYVTAHATAGEPAMGWNMTMQGTDDGYTSIADSDYIGTAAAGDGLQAFTNADEVLIDVLAVPGQSSQNIGDELIAIAEDRADIVALIDPPDWTDTGTVNSVTEILEWHNGTGGHGRTTALASSYAALYWTWLQIYDSYNSGNAWTAPSGHIAGIFAYNDSVAESWFAPAGPKRGIILKVTDTRYSPKWSDRQSLMAVGQNVNPIVNFSGVGVTVYGQLTLLRASTFLRKLKTRRMMNEIKRTVVTASRGLQFDPHDAITWRDWIGRVTPFLEYVQSRRGITELAVKCDEDTNTAQYLNEDTMRAYIFVKPTPTAEVILIDAVLSEQGADFTELLANLPA